MPDKQPTMMTIREVARTGILSEHSLRLLVKEKKLPVIYIGKKALINYDKLCSALQDLPMDMRRATSPLWYNTDSDNEGPFSA